MKLFISYSSKDRLLVQQIADDLEMLGHEVWFDPKLTTTGGQAWWDNILAQIFACDVFIFALSDDSLASLPCQREFGYAYDLNKRILPVVIRTTDLSNIPFQLKALQYIFYENRSNDPKVSLILGGSLTRLPAAKSPPDPLPEAPPVPISDEERYLSEAQRLLTQETLSQQDQLTFLYYIDLVKGDPVFRSRSISVLQNFLLRDEIIAGVMRRGEDLYNELLLQANNGKENTPATQMRITKSPSPAQSSVPRQSLRLPIAVIFGLIAVVVVGVILSTNVFRLTSSVSPTPSPTPVTKNADWTPFARDFDGVTMVLVPAGCFMMGTENPPASSYDNEKPTTSICFDRPFWIDKTDVTQAQFTRFGGKAAKTPAFAGDNRPVENITWFESRDFCAKRGARLPTEAEWEYAARGPDNLVYPWGNTFIGENAVNSANSNNQTADVGSKPAGASWVGALDMSGNVLQWVNTLYKLYPYNKDDGRESNDNTNRDRVRRGSSWSDGASDVLRSAIRFSIIPSYTDGSGGFRCARSQ